MADANANTEFSGRIIEVDYERSTLLIRHEGAPPEVGSSVFLSLSEFARAVDAEVVRPLEAIVRRDIHAALSYDMALERLVLARSIMTLEQRAALDEQWEVLRAELRAVRIGVRNSCETNDSQRQRPEGKIGVRVTEDNERQPETGGAGGN